jgi:hypothetical protein
VKEIERPEAAIKAVPFRQLQNVIFWMQFIVPG